MEAYKVSEQYVRLVAIISELMRDNYYGDIEIKFKDGKIVSCFKRESLIV